MRMSGAFVRAFIITVVAAGFVVAGETISTKGQAEQTTLKVEKVSCESSCAPAELTAGIEAALRKVPGVKTVKTDLRTNLVTVEHEKGKAALAELTEAAKAAGFIVLPASNEKTRTPEKKTTKSCCSL